MSKNVIHNFDVKIKNSSKINSSEELTKTFIKELAKVSIEKKEQKDIVQLWQEQKDQNTAINFNNSNTSTKGGAVNTLVGIMQSPTASASTTPLVSEDLFTAPIGGGAADNTGKTLFGSSASSNIIPSISGAENTILNSQVYAGVFSQQSLTVPENLQINSNEPSLEAIKAEIKKKLEEADSAKDLDDVNYWRAISKAFEEGATFKDFEGKPEHILFNQMYAMLKEANLSNILIQSFNWEIVREKMIKAIDSNILKGSISKADKDIWEKIKKQLADDRTNIANLFEQYDELFLLLKEVEGLDTLPKSITITTKTKIYPNLSADKLYAAIGKEDVYVFLKKISKVEVSGSGVNKGAVKIKNSDAISFIVGESLEFFLDETLLNQTLNKKENINWVVYKDGKKLEAEFRNEGTSFSYNFDKQGIYIIEAYGAEAGVNKIGKANKSGFIKVNIVAQDIQISAPSNAKGEFIRPFIDEKVFKVSLKNTDVKTLNPLKLYYQIETVIAGKTSAISEERELDATGIIKLAMPDLGTYKIKVASKDQYGLVKEFKTSVIKNEVTSIGLVENTSNNNVFLLGIPDNKITLETKKFKINPPTDDEKEDVRWMIYDAKNKPYLAQGTTLFTDKKDSKKDYIHKWNSFNMLIPQKEGQYTVEAFSNRQKGAKAESVFKFEVKQPEITEVYWAWSGGSKKTSSGFAGEGNYIKALVPHYENQKVRIYFYLNNKKTNHFIDIKTNNDGAIFKEIKFDADFQKAIEFQDKKSNKIGFKLLGIQNSKPYPFISPANYEADTTLSVTTDKKILDVYFTYDGNRVKAEDEVPFGKEGAIVTIVAKTQNMVGEEIVLTAHKKNEKPSFIGKVTVNSEGVATTSFLLKNLDKKLKIGTKIKYYAGVEGYPTKHLDNKVLVMIVGEGKVSNKFDENDPQLVWGAKVSKEFRIKVVKIAKKLKVDPNWIMTIIAKETSLTFDPHIDNGIGYVGLIQFSEDSAEGVGTTHAELKKMTAETQLDYVEKRFEKLGKNGYQSLTDLYLAVLQPTSVGQGDKDGNVLWTSKRMAYYNNPSYHKEKGEYDNKIIKKGKTKRGFEEGTTYMWEVRKELESIEEEGKYARNTWHDPLDRMELRGWYSTWRPEDSNHGVVPTRNAGKHDGLDLYASEGTSVFACVDGIRVGVGPNPSKTYGNTITVRGFYNGKEYHFFYAHLSETYIKIGEKVKAGKKIGLTGKTGNAKDLLAKQTHLHFEVRKSSASQGAGVNPIDAISELKSTVNVNPNKENQK